MLKYSDLIKKNEFFRKNKKILPYFIKIIFIIILIFILYFFYQKIFLLDNKISKNNSEISSLKNNISLKNYQISLLNDNNYSEKIKEFDEKIDKLEKDVSNNSTLNSNIKNIIDKKFSKILSNSWILIDKNNFEKNFLSLKNDLKNLDSKILESQNTFFKNQIITKWQTESPALEPNKEYNKILKKVSDIEKKLYVKNNEEKFKEKFYSKNYSYLFNYDKNNSTKISNSILKPKSLKLVNVKKWSFSEWIRNFPLKKNPDWVYSFLWKKIWNKNRVSWILDLDVWKNQECADTAMRLWWEYLFAKNKTEDLNFKLENHTKNPIFVKNLDRKSFKKYFQYQFAYSSSYSLKRDLKTIQENEILPWDLIVLRKYWKKTWHVFVIMEVAKSLLDWKTKVMLGQWDIPAENFFILKNKPFNDWYAYYKDEFTEKSNIAKITSSFKASLFWFLNNGFKADLSWAWNNFKNEDYSNFNWWFDLDTFLNFAKKHDPNWTPVLKRFY